MRRVFFDTETTGVKSDKDFIIEIAAIDGDSGEEFVSLVNPGSSIPVEASRIHGIDDAMVANAPSFAQVGQQFIDFCGPECALIAHNNERFDKLFLQNEAKRHGLTIPNTWVYLDSLMWARRYRPDLPRHALQFLRQVYGFEENQAHRALDDVIILQKVFDAMTDDLSLDTIIDLLEEQKRVLHMPFGKHRGKLLREVPKDYIRWLLDSGALDKGENALLKESFVQAGLLPC